MTSLGPSSGLDGSFPQLDFIHLQASKEGLTNLIGVVSHRTLWQMLTKQFVQRSMAELAIMYIQKGKNPDLESGAQES